jgi:SM-20-related protein
MQLSSHHINLEQLVDQIANHGFCVIDNFLDDTVTSALATETESLKLADAMTEAGVGREHLAINKTIRGDSIYWLNEDNATAAQQSYLQQMERLRFSLNQHLYLGLFGLESHLASYPIGTFYKKHLDCFASNDPNNSQRQSQRKVSCIVYLNQNWKNEDGGQLRLYLNETDASNNEKSIDISPIAGRAVIFLSDTFYHEVLPASRERISLTGWFFTRQLS